MNMQTSIRTIKRRPKPSSRSSRKHTTPSCQQMRKRSRCNLVLG